jgi:hypothetical protein
MLFRIKTAGINSGMDMILIKVFCPSANLPTAVTKVKVVLMANDPPRMARINSLE